MDAENAPGGWMSPPGRRVKFVRCSTAASGEVERVLDVAAPPGVAARDRVRHLLQVVEASRERGALDVLVLALPVSHDGLVVGADYVRSHPVVRALHDHPPPLRELHRGQPLADVPGDVAQDDGVDAVVARDGLHHANLHARDHRFLRLAFFISICASSAIFSSRLSVQNFRSSFTCTLMSSYASILPRTYFSSASTSTRPLVLIAPSPRACAGPPLRSAARPCGPCYGAARARSPCG